MSIFRKIFGSAGDEKSDPAQPSKKQQEEAGRRFIQAVKNGDQASARQLVEADKSVVNAKDEAGKTALHWAASAGVVGMAEMLLRAGADPNARDGSGKSPMVAAYNISMRSTGAGIEMSGTSNNSMVLLLLKYGATPGKGN